VQLGQKIATFEPQQEGPNLDQIQNILYGVYWDKYQGFKTLPFWKNVLFQKAAPPYCSDINFLEKNFSETNYPEIKHQETNFLGLPVRMKI
jgi:hypothetical protein